MFAIGDRVWPGISKLIEECGEVVQVCGKLMGSRGDTKHWSCDLHEMMHDELGDLLAAIDFVISRCGLDRAKIVARKQAKVARFNDWHAHEVPPADSSKGTT